MKSVSLLIIGLFAFVLISCGEKAREMKNAMELAKNAPEIAKNMEKSQNAAQAKIDERKKKGDTLAMPFQKLQQYLPTSLAGYKAETPGGESMNMPGMSYSSATIRFSKENSATEDNVTVELFDYNQVGAMFTAATLWMSGFSREDAKGYEKTFNPGVNNVFGFEKFEKERKYAEVTFAIGYRFVLTIKGYNQTNGDNLINLGKSMKLGELAGM